MFALIPTNQFKKDVKVLKKRSANNEELITDFLTELAKNGASGIINFPAIIKMIGRLISSRIY